MAPHLRSRWGLAACAVAVLVLACFNLSFRVGHEALQDWDESLYATSAWEMVTSGHWIATTFNGALDYYNSKPPLNVWLIALAFKACGPSLVSLRLASLVSAFLTIALVQWWTWRHLGPRVAVLASLILSTTFGFFHVHSARTANTDALFTLLLLLTAMTLVAEGERPWRRVWLGPIFAAVFLLRGMAVLMPLLLVLLVDVVSRREAPRRWMPSIAACGLFLLPTAAWALARYRLDRWAFFARMFNYDLVQRAVAPIEGHPGGPMYYLNILHKNQFDWVIAGVVVLAVCALFRRRRPALADTWDRVRRHRMTLVLIGWAVVTLGIPTLMQTKVPWYLNSFYPVFAMVTAVVAARAYDHLAQSFAARRYVMALTAALVIVAAAAESRLLWYSYVFRDLRLSGQSLILMERDHLRGRRLYQDEARPAASFVARTIVGAIPQSSPVAVCCWTDELAPGDYLLTAERISVGDLELVRSNERRWLYRRRQ